MALPALPQTNCTTVNWLNNTSQWRLQITGYTNGSTLIPCTRYFSAIDGTGVPWDGTFTFYDGSATYSAPAGLSLGGVGLDDASLYYANSKWTLQVSYWFNNGGVEYGNLLWKGTLSNTNPIGTYTNVDGCFLNGSDSAGAGPGTLAVSCYNWQPSSCQVNLTVYPSPYHGSRFDTNCDTTVKVRHWGPDGAAPAVADTVDANGAYHQTIYDGEIIGIQWPNCCDTGWGIMAEGPLTTLNHGVVSLVQRITLCVPNGAGVIPIGQVTPTNSVDGKPGSLMVPPYSLGAAPVITNVAYNACRWKAHITCTGCDPGSILNPTCSASFEVIDIFRCDAAHWVMQQGDPSAEGGSRFIPPTEVLYDTARIGFRRSILTNAPWNSTTITTNGLTYQWYSN